MKMTIPPRFKGDKRIERSFTTMNAVRCLRAKLAAYKGSGAPPGRPARTVSLRVAVPSHTPLLVEATKQFRTILRESSPRLPSPGYRLLSGIDGDTVHDMETGIDN